jgi:hypothetical protein
MNSDTNSIPQLLENAVSSSASRRNELASDIMKIFLSNQGKYRRMTILSRIKYYFGSADYKSDFDYNFQDIAKKSYEMADSMLSAE